MDFCKIGSSSADPFYFSREEEERLYNTYLDQCIVDAPNDVPYREVGRILPPLGLCLPYQPLAQDKRSPTPSPLLPQPPSPVFPRTAEMRREPSGLLLGPRLYPNDAHRSPAIFTPHLEESQRLLSLENLKTAVRTQPLDQTSVGRTILSLLSLRWFVCASGFAATQINPREQSFSAALMTHWLGWLDRGLRIHRSTSTCILAIEDLGPLNQLFYENKVGRIIVHSPPYGWPYLEYNVATGRPHALPLFMRAGFGQEVGFVADYAANTTQSEWTFHHEVAHATAPKRQRIRANRSYLSAKPKDRADAQGPRKTASAAHACASEPSPAEQHVDADAAEQDGNRLLHGVDAQRAGQAAHAKPRWEPESRPRADAVSPVSDLRQDA